MLKVSAAIILKDNLVLLAKRAAHKHMGGFWEFPGGKVEKGETAAESLVRELREELGIETKVISEFHRNIHQYEEKEVLLISFIVEQISGDIKLLDHDEIDWVKKEDLLSYKLAPADIPIVEKLMCR